MSEQPPELRKEVYVSSQGHPCVICKGEYAFPSSLHRGVYLDRLLYPDVFICWECVHALVKKLLPHVLGESYKQVFCEGMDALPL